MLTVKTYLAPSSVHGIGLFADEEIPANSIIWRFENHFDRIFDERDFLLICQDLDSLSLNHMLISSYRRKGAYFYLTDNARFINHSECRSNIVFSDDLTEIASRDISPGEELLENYQDCYDPDDYFFKEFSISDPRLYVINLFLKGVGNVNRKDFS